MHQSRLMLLWLELQCPETSVTDLTDGGTTETRFCPHLPSPRRYRAQSLKELASGTAGKLGRALKKEKIYRCFFPPQRNVTTLKSPLNC